MTNVCAPFIDIPKQANIQHTSHQADPNKHRDGLAGRRDVRHALDPIPLDGELRGRRDRAQHNEIAKGVELL
jgi:hypothetical protein